MLEETKGKNIIYLCGIPLKKAEYSHQNKLEKYYTFPLGVERLSGAMDIINVVVRQNLLERVELEEKQMMYIRGEVRSFNNKSKIGNKLVITVFAKQLGFCDEPAQNSVELFGTICKPPVKRRTPMGRDICDLMLAVNRKYGRSDYLPCIAWGENALKAGDWLVGDDVRLDGRLQSRKYIKIEDGQSMEKTAYEISVTSIERILNDKADVEKANEFD